MRGSHGCVRGSLSRYGVSSCCAVWRSRFDESARCVACAVGMSGSAAAADSAPSRSAAAVSARPSRPSPWRRLHRLSVPRSRHWSGCAAQGVPAHLVVDFFGGRLVRLRLFSGVATGFGTREQPRFLIFEVPRWIVHRAGLRSSIAPVSRGVPGRTWLVATAESACRLGTAPGRFPRLCRFDPARRSRVTSPRAGSVSSRRRASTAASDFGANGASQGIASAIVSDDSRGSARAVVTIRSAEALRRSR